MNEVLTLINRQGRTSTGTRPATVARMRRATATRSPEGAATGSERTGTRGGDHGDREAVRHGAQTIFDSDASHLGLLRTRPPKGAGT